MYLTIVRLVMVAVSRSRNYMEWVLALCAAIMYLINLRRPVRTDQHRVAMMQHKMRVKNAERLKQMEGKGELYPWSDGTMRREDPTYGLIDRDIQIKVHNAYPGISIAQRVAFETNLQERRNRNGY